MSESVQGLSRRRLLGASGTAALGLGTGGLASCSKAAKAAETAAAFNPAIREYGWLDKIATDVAATAVENVITGGLKDIWHAWTGPVKKKVSEQVAYPWLTDSAWVHTVPPVVLVGMSKSNKSDPMSDALLACVNTGKDAVLLEPWAWQAVSMFINELTTNKTGADLAGFQALCVLSLIPSAPPQQENNPKLRVGWMTYQTRNGTVEIDKVVEPDGSTSAIITAHGIPDADHKPSAKKYQLPTKAAAA